MRAGICGFADLLLRGSGDLGIRRRCQERLFKRLLILKLSLDTPYLRAAHPSASCCLQAGAVSSTLQLLSTKTGNAMGRKELLPVQPLLEDRRNSQLQDTRVREEISRRSMSWTPDVVKCGEEVGSTRKRNT